MDVDEGVVIDGEEEGRFAVSPGESSKELECGSGVFVVGRTGEEWRRDNCRSCWEPGSAGEWVDVAVDTAVDGGDGAGGSGGGTFLKSSRWMARRKMGGRKERK